MTINASTILAVLGVFVNQASGLINGNGDLDISGGNFTNNGTIAPSVNIVN